MNLFRCQKSQLLHFLPSSARISFLSGVIALLPMTIRRLHYSTLLRSVLSVPPGAPQQDKAAQEHGADKGVMQTTNNPGHVTVEQLTNPSPGDQSRHLKYVRTINYLSANASMASRFWPCGTEELC
jgi:hypothetical protein